VFVWGLNVTDMQCGELVQTGWFCCCARGTECTVP